MNSVPRLHLISNSQICPAERLPDVVADAVSGGVTAVHLREPDMELDELIALGRRILDAISGTDARLLVNGRVEAAIAVGADGLHLPERQCSELASLRSQLPAGSIAGVSVHSLEAAEAAETAGADYVIAGHVFETSSKPGIHGRGLKFVEQLTSSISIPVIAIGGISPVNVGSVISAGAHGVAVLSGILSAVDPQRAAAEYAIAINESQG